VNPTVHDATETLCSLTFAARLRGLQLSASQQGKAQQAAVDVKALEAQLQAAVSENEMLKEQLRAAHNAAAADNKEKEVSVSPWQLDCCVLRAACWPCTHAAKAVYSDRSLQYRL
jgi:hypothetical protein